MPFRGGPGFGLQYRTKEERREIAKKSVATRMKNNHEKVMLQKCMRSLLEMDVRKPEYKEVLISHGFKPEDFTNKTLLMVALFRKGMTGDVAAIREIVDMMDKLDIYNETKRVQGQVNITIHSVESPYVPSEKEEQEIEEIENPKNNGEENTEWDIDHSSEKWEMQTSEEQEEWGKEIYTGET